jgi:hypothetical protein
LARHRRALSIGFGSEVDMSIAPGFALAAVAWMILLVGAESGRAQGASAPRGKTVQESVIHLDGLSLWLKSRFSDSELEALRHGTLVLEPHFCGCYDTPTKHFPYSVVLLRTPRGDLVARPERKEGSLSFTPLAVRAGDRYCELDAEESCYGVFSDPCDFTDFRYGPALVAYFPSCKSETAEPTEE